MLSQRLTEPSIETPCCCTSVVHQYGSLHHSHFLECHATRPPKETAKASSVSFSITFAIACLFIVSKVRAADFNISPDEGDSIFTMPFLASGSVLRILPSEYFSIDSKQYSSEEYLTG